MKATIDLEQFINVLIEAKKAIAVANDLESKVSDATQRHQALTSQIEILHKESDSLTHAIRDHKKAVDEHIARERANADAAVTAYRASKEAEKQQIDQSVAAVKRDSESAIASYQAQESTAKQATVQAKAELAAITEALDKSRNELAKAAKYANMARA